ncbi:MAG: pentapeptide repeat-containing protein, partial [Okeania sp. SIO4D6]|nr:pentapeptide repeat-containing protein [Okeania sp. SIO4D6]
ANISNLSIDGVALQGVIMPDGASYEEFQRSMQD